jgi:hypothetical protein
LSNPAENTVAVCEPEARLTAEFKYAFVPTEKNFSTRFVPSTHTSILRIGAKFVAATLNFTGEVALAPEAGEHT